MYRRSPSPQSSPVVVSIREPKWEDMSASERQAQCISMGPLYYPNMDNIAVDHEEGEVILGLTYLAMVHIQILRCEAARLRHLGEL